MQFSLVKIGRSIARPRHESHRKITIVFSGRVSGVTFMPNFSETSTLILKRQAHLHKHSGPITGFWPASEINFSYHHNFWVPTREWGQQRQNSKNNAFFFFLWMRFWRTLWPYHELGQYVIEIQKAFSYTPQAPKCFAGTKDRYQVCYQ